MSPKMPTYDSHRQLTTQQPQFLAPKSADEKITADIVKGLGEIAEVGLKFSKALDVMQWTTSRANYETGLLDIMARAKTEPDHTKAESYLKEISKLKGDNLKGFTNSQARDRAAFELRHENERAVIEIGGIFKLKTIEVGQVAAFKLIDLEKSNYINTPDEKGKIESALAIKSIINKQVEVGIFSPKDADKLYEKTIKDARVVIKDQEGLKKKKEKEILLAYEFAKNEKENELIQARINMVDRGGNPLTDDTIIEVTRDAMADGEVSKEFGEVLINSLKSIKLTDPTDLDSIMVYNELADRKVSLIEEDRRFGWGIGHRTFREKAQYRADVLKANADGFLTKADMNTLLSDTADDFYKDPKVRSAVRQVTVQSSLYDTPEAKARVKAEMHRTLMEKIIAGKAPDEALDEVIREHLVRELGEVADKDEYGFTIGEIRKGYEYIGGNKWREK